MTDPKIIERCLKNDRKAQFELYKSQYGFLMSIGYRYHSQKEDVEPLVNNCFMKVLSKLDTYKHEVPFEAWIRRIMINTVIDEFRKNKYENENVHAHDFQEQPFMVTGVSFNEASQFFDAEELLKMIEKLPNMTKKVFNLFAIDGYTHEEISKLLGISDGTSKWHVSDARRRLQEQIQKKISKENLIDQI